MTSDTLGSTSDRLLVAVLVAVVLHVAVIFGLRFRLPQPLPVIPTLDIELVQEPDGRRPDKADYRAAHDSEGGVPQQAKAQPLPPSPSPGQPRSGRPKAERPAKKPVLTRQRAEAAVATPMPEPVNHPRLNPGLLARQIAELGVAPQRQLRFGSERVTPISQIRAHKYIAAAYERDWQKKVEFVGDTFYSGKVSGRLLVSVWVAKDGTVKKVEIHRSSGPKNLERAVRQIIDLAKPFARFPKELAAQTDILVITRTWNFYNKAGLAMGR